MIIKTQHHLGPICRICRAAWDNDETIYKVHQSCVDALFCEGLPEETNWVVDP